MRARCPNCDRPTATDSDYENIPEGEGEHLCWAPWSMGVCEVPEDEVIARLRAENAALRQELLERCEAADHIAIGFQLLIDSVLDRNWEGVEMLIRHHTDNRDVGEQ